MTIKAVVFDFGGVLIDWNPRYVYRELLKTEEEVEDFLTNICTHEWNHQLDLGKSWDVSVAELSAKHPDKADLIKAYRDRWADMLGGPIHESVDLLMELKARGIPLYGLTNWSHETFDVARKEFPFLRLFDGIVVSGEVKMAKPDPAIYEHMLSKFKLNPRETLFIDDRRENVQTAWDLGINATQFLSPRQLEEDLVGYGLIPSDEPYDDEDGSPEHGSSCCGGGCGCHH